MILNQNQESYLWTRVNQTGFGSQLEQPILQHKEKHEHEQHSNNYLIFGIYRPCGIKHLAYNKKKDDHDSSDCYFFGGRSLTFPLIAGSLRLTSLSTEQLVGLNGAAFQHGRRLPNKRLLTRP